MTTYRRCPSCAHWYEKDLGPCPECEEPPARRNNWLQTASLNNQLLKQAEHSSTDYDRTYKHFRKEIKRAVKEA